jgi:hypothetical protein
MTHFLYLLIFAFFVSVGFGSFATGSPLEKIWLGAKNFLQFVGVALALAWIFYFLPF